MNKFYFAIKISTAQKTYFFFFFFLQSFARAFLNTLQRQKGEEKEALRKRGEEGVHAAGPGTFLTCCLFPFLWFPELLHRLGRADLEPETPGFRFGLSHSGGVRPWASDSSVKWRQILAPRSIR